MDGLALSPDASVAALIRCLLWRAAASSPAALIASLRRYRRLLLHARDAAGAGHRPSRQSLVQLTGGLGVDWFVTGLDDSIKDKDTGGTETETKP